MDRLATALRRDEVVKGVDLGVEHVERGLTTDAVLAGGDGLARRHRFVEVNAVSTAVLLVIGSVAAALAHCRPADAERQRARWLDRNSMRRLRPPSAGRSKAR